MPLTRPDNVRHWAAMLIILILAAGVATCAPAAARQVTLTIDEHTIEEIETERLVCAVAWSTLGHNVAISCVPNIPAMFEEPGR